MEQICTIRPGEPIFSSERALDDSLHALAADSDAGMGLMEVVQIFGDYIQNQVRTGNVVRSRQPLRVRVLEVRDFTRGAFRLPEAKCRVRAVASGVTYWVSRDSLES